MKMIVIGSGSAGNCYLLQCERETLIVECGERFSEVKRAIDFKIGTIAGALVSHQHKDHAGYINEYATAGITIAAPKETLEATRIEGLHNTIEIHAMKGRKIGGFSVVGIPVEHDVPCMAYYIRHPEMGSAMFITDTFTFRPIISGSVGHWIIEANYSDEILDERIIKSDISFQQRKRIMTTHMEIGTTRSVLAKQDLKGTRDITLIHLSDSNSNAEVFRKTIEESTGIPTFIADKGITVDFGKKPY